MNELKGSRDISRNINPPLRLQSSCFNFFYNTVMNLIYTATLFYWMDFYLPVLWKNEILLLCFHWTPLTKYGLPDNERFVKKQEPQEQHNPEKVNIHKERENKDRRIKMSMSFEVTFNSASFTLNPYHMQNCLISNTIWTELFLLFGSKFFESS